MATNWGNFISNTGSGAATGGSVAGPWGAVAGGALGAVNALFGEDPDEARKKAQKEYNKRWLKLVRHMLKVRVRF